MTNNEEIIKWLEIYRDGKLENGILPHYFDLNNDTVNKCIAALRNQPRWVLCSERMPEEKDSIFAKFYGTEKWRPAMFRRGSDEVIVSFVYDDGSEGVTIGRTIDGIWRMTDGISVVKRTVVAWHSLPEPYRGGEENG